MFGGVWARETLLAYGGWDVGAGRATRTPRWRAGSSSATNGSCACRRWRRNTPRATRSGRCGANTSTMATSASGPRFAVSHTMRRSHLLAPGVVVTTIAAVAGPEPVRRAARAGLAVYAAALAGAGVTALRSTDDRTAAVLVPVVLAAMHFGHGAGMLRGVARHGVPAAAVARALGLDGRSPPGLNPGQCRCSRRRCSATPASRGSAAPRRA